MTRRRRSILVVALTAGLAFGAETAVHASDHVQMKGSDVALRECDVIDVQGGQVVFRNARGRRDWRDVEQIAALRFEGFPQLDQAESLLAGRQHDAGLRALLRALLIAPADSPERRWVLVRLVNEHIRRSEPVPAMAHFADLVAMDDDGSWVALADRIPERGDDAATYPQCVEAQTRVAHALTVCRNRSLVKRLGAHQERVEARQLTAAASWRGDEPDGATLRSGYTEAELTGRAPARPTTPEPADDRAPRQSGDAIAALLDAERFEEAVLACEALIQDANTNGSAGGELPPDQLATLLVQYGDALRGVRRSRDAALMYLRAALLLPDEPTSVDGYLAAARTYRDDLGNVDAARRIAQRGLAHARGLGHEPAVRRALALVRSLESNSAP